MQWFDIEKEVIKERMEGVSGRVCKGLLTGYYWRRRGYERLNASGRRRRKNRVELAVAGRRRRFWKIKITPKLRFSPKKFFTGLRDAYVNMMLRLANSTVINSVGISGVVGNGVGAGFGRAPLKEYDEKTIVEMYKSLGMAHGQLLLRDAPRIGTQIVGRW
uniref:Uncharacterized protein n=1 Tax=Davidia involucrata TaxID=16924 RepID=A0A5B7BRV1_DAVIN